MRARSATGEKGVLRIGNGQENWLGTYHRRNSGPWLPLALHRFLSPRWGIRSQSGKRNRRIPRVAGQRSEMEHPIRSAFFSAHEGLVLPSGGRGRAFEPSGPGRRSRAFMRFPLDEGGRCGRLRRVGSARGCPAPRLDRIEYHSALRASTGSTRVAFLAGK